MDNVNNSKLAIRLLMVVARDFSERGTERFGQMFGVSAANLEEIKIMVVERLRAAEGVLLRVHAEWIPDWSGKDSDLTLVSNPNKVGIWYTSGRVWFEEGDTEILDDLI